MKLIVGLGNPGNDYQKTRHNAGFMVVDRLWEKRGDPSQAAKGRFAGVTYELNIGAERVLLLKPTTYMNLSGRSVSEALSFFKLDPSRDLLVVVDDVSLPTGTIRVRAGGGAGGHNGLKDIQRALSSQAYARLRIGIDACPPMMKLEDYVLGRFTTEQAALLAPALDRSINAIESFVTDGIDAAMNKFNPAEPAPSSSPPSGKPQGKGPASGSGKTGAGAAGAAGPSGSSTPSSPPAPPPGGSAGSGGGSPVCSSGTRTIGLGPEAHRVRVSSFETTRTHRGPHARALGASH